MEDFNDSFWLVPSNISRDGTDFRIAKAFFNIVQPVFIGDTIRVGKGDDCALGPRRAVISGMIRAS